jgi:hypothetical protein
MTLTNPMNWRAAARVLRPLRDLLAAHGRRLAAAGLLTAAFAGAVGTLYANADVPGTRVSAASVKAASVRTATPGEAGRRVGERQVAKVFPTPERAAVAAYAARVGVAASKVRALQRQPVRDGRTRVLVMATLNSGRLRTAMVTVARERHGWRGR